MFYQHDQTNIINHNKSASLSVKNSPDSLNSLIKITNAKLIKKKSIYFVIIWILQELRKYKGSRKELSYKEIGELIGISENYVAVKLKRIKKKLAICLTTLAIIH